MKSAVTIAIIGLFLSALAREAAADEPASKTKTASTSAATPAAKSSLDRFEPLPPFLMLPNQKSAREEVEKSGLPPELVAKMLKGGGLKLDEIEQVAAKGVSTDTLTKYLRSVGATYQLTTKDIDRLRAAHVSDALIDYLLTTPSRRPLYLYSSPWFHHSDYHHGFHHHDHHYGAHDAHHH